MIKQKLLPYWLLYNNREIITKEVYINIRDLICKDICEEIQGLSEVQLYRRIQGTDLAYFPKPVLDMEDEELCEEIVDRSLDIVPCLNLSSVEVTKLLLTYEQWIKGEYYTINNYLQDSYKIEFIFPSGKIFTFTQLHDSSCHYGFDVDFHYNQEELMSDCFDNMDTTRIFAYKDIERFYNYHYFREFGISRPDLYTTSTAKPNNF